MKAPGAICCVNRCRPVETWRGCMRLNKLVKKLVGYPTKQVFTCIYLAFVSKVSLFISSLVSLVDFLLIQTLLSFSEYQSQPPFAFGTNLKFMNMFEWQTPFIST